MSDNSHRIEASAFDKLRKHPGGVLGRYAKDDVLLLISSWINMTHNNKYIISYTTRFSSQKSRI